MPIKILSHDVATKIAAGEVVERPASAAKELIENAIDAQSSTIRVEIVAGGKQLIKISDDGVGISHDEVPLAFERHATSKITSVEELSTVKTLGFRGEALSSIAAVSQLTMITCPAEQTGGRYIRIEGGFQQSLKSVGAGVGTTISVEKLFYNVPARQKFLKANSTETGHIHRIVSHYAMAHPHIRFSLTSNHRLIFQTDGNGNLYDVLVAIWGIETAKLMVKIDTTKVQDGNHKVLPLQDITVSGYIGNHSLHKGQRNHMVFFVNGRWIQDRTLAQAVIQAYHTFLPIGRYPVAVLNVTMPSCDVDVNVHPTKSEVRFKHGHVIFKQVQRPVRETLVTDAPMIRSAQTIGMHGESSFPGGADRSQFGIPQHGERASQFAFDVQQTLPDDESHMPVMRVVGQVQSTYIITEGTHGMYLIDQHAAHERVMYDKLMAQHQAGAVVSQKLLTPPLLELSPAKSAVLEAEMDTLTALGFEIEHFGGNAYRLLAIPEIFSSNDPMMMFNEILADMAEGIVPLSRETHERIATIACKRASIKAGQTLSFEEMRELIQLLEKSEHPRTCPHGRPTMIHMSIYQLAREFGRH